MAAGRSRGGVDDSPSPPVPRAWRRACGLASSVLLGVVDALQGRLGWQRARVLADAALLTPLVPLTTGWLR